jgi:hypothetical protein
MTANRFKYWGNWGLPIRGVFGKLTYVSIPTIVMARGEVSVRRWRGEVSVRRWRGEVKRRGD